MARAPRAPNPTPTHPTTGQNRSAHRPTPPKHPIDTTDVVLTPGGMRPRKLVHILEPGQHVSAKGERVRIIETSTGRLVKDLGESGSAKGKTREAPARTLHAPFPSLPDIAWIENAQWRNGGADPIVYFSTTWIVPPVPSSDDGQTVFLFNGMQPDSGAHILQPVLQWGSSGAGGGSYWSITNWYADGQGGAAVTNPPVKVNPGDVLQGVMTCTSQSGAEYDYKCSFIGFSSLDVTVTDVDQLTWAYQTLECYGATFTLPLTQCSDYPATPMTAMYDIAINTGTPGTNGTAATLDWVAVTNFTDCGQQCAIISNDSPGGVVYLYYRQPAASFYFVVDKGTFGVDEVKDVIAKSGGVFSAAFFLTLEGFTVQQLTIDVPSLVWPVPGGPFTTLNGVTVQQSKKYSPVYDTTNLYSPQRIMFPFDVVFTTDAVTNDFPGTGIAAVAMSAEIKFGSASLATAQDLRAGTEMFLAAGAVPYFTNVDPQQGNEFYLSQDLRVFTITPTANNQTPIDNVPFIFQSGSPTTLDTAAAYSYIRALIGHCNSTYSNPPGQDPFDLTHPVLPGQGTALTGDSTVTPATPNPHDSKHPYMNYNFALARESLQSTHGLTGEAAGVRVFFRMFTAQTVDTDFINAAGAVSSSDPNITYPSLPSAAPNAPTSPLPGTDASGTINGCTLPFFAAADQSDLAPGGVNLQTIEIPLAEDQVWAYFGCFLNVYDPALFIGPNNVQSWLPASHHCCLVAQIAFADTPIENANGLIENPANSSLLAQRNLQITPSGNPGFPATHLIPQTFDVRPSPAPFAAGLASYPDELMIDWRNTPHGSTAQIYWPQVSSADVLALAASLYPAVKLTAVDAHTIGCAVGTGYTFVPIPRGGNASFAGLITLQLPQNIHATQRFNVVVRRLTSRRYQPPPIIAGPRGTAAAPPGHGDDGGDVNWRTIAGAFQMEVPVERDETILPGEENLLAILKWRLQRLPPGNRWYPVLRRWIGVVTGRVRGLGGDPAKIDPSPLGTANQGVGLLVKPDPRHDPVEHGDTGKIVGMRYDRFGDFVGFDLMTLAGEERHFRAREAEMEALVRLAWIERTVLTVLRSHHDPACPSEIVLRSPPRRE